MNRSYLVALLGVGLVLSPLSAAIPCKEAAKTNYDCFSLSWNKKADVQVRKYEELEDLINFLLDGDDSSGKCYEDKIVKKWGETFEEEFSSKCFNEYWQLALSSCKASPNRGQQLGSLGVVFYTYMDTTPTESALRDILGTAKLLLNESKDTTILAFVLRGLKYYHADAKEMLDLYVKLMSHDDVLVRQMAYAELSYQTNMKLPFDADKPLDTRGPQLEAILKWLSNYKPGKA